MMLRSFGYLYRDQLQPLTDLLLRLPAGHPAFEITMAALVDLSHKEAQDAVVDALEGNQSNPANLEMIVGMASFMDNPTITLQNAINEIRGHENENIAMTAELATGVLAGKLIEATKAAEDKTTKDDYRFRLQELEGEWLERLKMASNNKERIRLLKIIGNSGSPVANHLLEGFLHSDDVDLAGQAILTIRFQSIRLSRRFIEVALGQLGKDDFEEALASALSFIPEKREVFTINAGLIDRLSSTRAKIQCLQTLYSLKQYDKNMVVSLVERYASHAKDKDLQEFADHLLNDIRMGS